MGKMKILYGTGNQAKLSDMKKRLSSLSEKIECIGLQDLGMETPNVCENGRTPLENARKKAEAYYKAFQIPVFSCDTGLYFDNVPDEIQPGVHVRRVHGKHLTDQEMLVYYAGLASQYGGLRARYRNAVCFVLDAQHRYEAMTDSMQSREFLLTDKPHRDGILEQGYPLDCLSVDVRTGKYFNDLSDTEWMRDVDGMLEFFREVLTITENSL